ncbi:CDGSH iron-sulfur domain-containing protein [Sulfurovum sp. XGS-02]|uniref:CDGSH iron-sulfur domain-containing protein n=1 Tax=Sulfurovum sp. XGS-02 TaxID=2925411 RepID=UPI0020698877|nr:CDGSH iron-sulfur domain-containing protein [Sulfurovum sp. XGS-02]UPT77887.1 CDGSH iron-sulfur domain-containing protein [Sulfurovum sp. XGS-02]
MKYPVRVKLEVGEKYLFCTCGKSADGVLCDGSHKGSTFSPKEFIATRTAESYLCRCKKSYNGVYCDGNHAKRETLNLDFLDS